jgi:hypothetical protein
MTAQLTASLVLKGDGSGAAAAANDVSQALDKTRDSATQAGAAAGAMAAPFDAATVAVKGQAAATQEANAALTASGAAKVEEIARLTQLASATSATTSSIRAISSAHAEYNSTVNAARALLAGGVITQAQYGSAIEAASAKLALANVVHDANSAALLKESGGASALKAAQQQLGEGAEETGVHIEGLTRQMEHLGASAGLGLGNARLLIYGFRDLAAVVATPVGGLVLVTAAILAVVAAAQVYESSVNQLDIAVVRNQDSLHLTEQGYLDLAKSIANASGISQSFARATLGEFLSAGAQSQQAITAATDAVKGYAIETGKSADEAEKDIAKMFTDPSKAAQDLTTQYGLFSQKQLDLIDSLQSGGNAAAAQQIVFDAFDKQVQQYATHTTALGNAWEDVKAGISDAVNFIGANAAKLGEFFAQLSGFGTNNNSAKSQVQGSLSGADAMSGADAENLNREQQAAKGLNDQYDQLGTTLSRISADENKMSIDLADGAMTATQYAKDYAGAEKQRADAIKKSQQATKDADGADKAHLATIRHLIDTFGETIALTEADVQALQKQADASDGTAESIKALQDQYDVQKKITPYITAQAELTKAFDDGKIKSAAYTTELAQLQADTAKVTEATQAQIAAQTELNAKQQITQQFGSLTSFYASYSDAIGGAIADQQTFFSKSTELLQLDLGHAQEWYDFWKDVLQKAGLAHTQYASELEDIYNNKVAKAYSDDLSRARDWGSGVEVALRKMTDDTTNWAKTSASLVEGFSNEFEDTLVKMITGSQDALLQFFQWIEEQLIKLAYQQYLASSLQGLFGDIVGSIGSLFGVTGAANAGPAGGGIAGGVMHGGGVVGRDVASVREVPAAVFAGAPRYHMGLLSDEFPAILQKGEIVLTELQQGIVNGALSRPILMHPGAGASDKPPVTINVHQGAGTEAKVGQPVRGSDGSFSIDVMVQSIDRALAKRSRIGQSAFTQSLENTHGLRRAPIGGSG